MRDFRSNPSNPSKPQSPTTKRFEDLRDIEDTLEASSEKNIGPDQSRAFQFEDEHAVENSPQTSSSNTSVSAAPKKSAPLKGKIEAALFITGRALSLKEISDIVDADIETVEGALLDLINDYSYREESSLDIDDSDGYILQVREDYAEVINKMMPVDISHAALRTLSAIAIKAPILQSDLIELRGSTAYDHIAELLSRKLVSKKREGRSYILNVTKNFYHYFKLTGEKRELDYLVRQSP
jgi:segregation and condensation protein B